MSRKSDIHTLRLCYLYDRLSNFEFEDIKNKGLRSELMREDIATWYDGFRTHVIKLDDILENIFGYAYDTLEKAVSYIDKYLHLDEVIKEKAKKTTKTVD